MRFNRIEVDKLKQILKEETGQVYTDEEVQTAGIQIMRMALQKVRRKFSIISNSKEVKR